MVAKDAIIYNGPGVVSLWSGDEGNEAQPKHSTWDKSLLSQCLHMIFLVV